MTSRAAHLSRMCLVCQMGVSQRTIAFLLRFPANLSRRPQRRLASEYSPQSKERVEALISGALHLNSDFKGRHGTKQRPRRERKGGPRGKVVQELAEWEIKPAQEDAKVARPVKETTSGVAAAPAEDSIPPESVHNSGESTSLRSDPGRSSRAKSSRHDLVNRRSLGVEALGKPIEAIVIKNPNNLKRSRKPMPILEEEQAGVRLPLDWQSVLRQPSDSIDEVCQNIEEIRPRDTTIVRRKDFDKMVERLYDGFTQEQLMTYFNKGNLDDVWEADTRPSYPWILRQSPWVAAEPNKWKGLTHKQRQAVIILTVQWKLEIQEHIQGPGRRVVWLNPNVFQLITRPSIGIIQRLSDDFLDRSSNERISTHHEECRLGIYTGKPTVTTILSRLDEIVQTIKSRIISLERIDPENLTGPVLDELAKITKTAMHYDAEKAELHVSWLAEPDRSTGQVEDPADIVLRLLVGRQSVPQTTEVHVLSETKPFKSKMDRFLIHQREKRGMSWRDKLRQWYRHVEPVGKAVDMTKPTLNLSESISLPEPELMSADEQAEVVATFGHILHTTRTLRATKSADARRVLSPRIPHPAALTLVAADEAPTTQKTAIVLHFALDITSTTSLPGAAIPQVRLQIPVNPSTDLSNFSFPDTAVLEATIPCRQADILLPGQSVDVRVTQTRLLPLDSNQASLQDFLNASQFNLLQGQLHTPSRTHFSIPNKWLCTGPKDETTNLPYMFTGLEIHQTVDTEWQGHTLRYSTIEAGQHAGQQQKLSIVAGTPHQDRSILTQEQLSHFMTLVEQTASGLHFSWDEGYKLMQERSREQFTWDMIDTEEPAERASTEEDVRAREKDTGLVTEELAEKDVYAPEDTKASKPDTGLNTEELGKPATTEENAYAQENANASKPDTEELGKRTTTDENAYAPENTTASKPDPDPDTEEPAKQATTKENLHAQQNTTASAQHTAPDTTDPKEHTLQEQDQEPSSSLQPPTENDLETTQ